MAIDVDDDFAEILSDLSRAVTYKAATLTDDGLSQEKIPSYDAGTTKNWVFFKRSEQKFKWAREGLREDGDAYVMLPTTDSINERDRVVVDGETYEVIGPAGSVKRRLGITALYVYCSLKKVAGVQV